ncbi:MAG: N-acetyl-alpha-D-glucosaminyl L-malate synthase BshA [Bacteroidetes bacterium]|jgi:N-acetyl-alpha-D-glucosaminyl L-malate synthase BshA|nr:N-acetyl-alpha-D-glucosaminyl L-malate synthase BshA [Bacteroidota bacterium]MBK6818480.1 N-acetyl-alpha-D-glucosaminyl L-malate synthase BshA [Bacteroidota bacterium]MBK7040762.1 N-acetyl-alpha-D-glucosaminyl L-malate synthase BshA [Bacteroidota bacterium]MBK8328572.1 N-acetyl-alpha-D-glucosaminyl L-malate synthase BshA [Bacteroidota bacterium]MBK9300517.1 N-acetyl-alpha-D-glucosaminyl L-malate synthase BshA [Bacteroidota bacterium]
MKIGIVCYPTFGGSGVLATELGKALADKGHIVHFITYQQPVRLDAFHPNIFYHEVTVPTYPLFDFPPYESALSSTMVDVILNEGLEILHVHYAIPHASSAYLANQILRKKGKNIPYITTLHGTDITLVGKDKMYEAVVTFSINESDAITAVSDNLKAETLQYFDIEKEIHVIPNFVDIKRFSQSNKDHFRKMLAPNGEKILAHVSNFRKVKRVEDVIYTFEKVRKQLPCKLLMIGDGPERQSMEALCRELGTCDDIRFLGKQEKLEEILSITDLFLLPSAYESFGLAALEAMGCQVPVISSNAGGIPEINIHGVTGYLTEVGDVDAMAAFSLALLQDEEKLAQFKKNALAQAEKFNINNIIPMYEKLYASLIPAETTV